MDLFAFLLVLLTIGAYFAPSVAAYVRKPPQMKMILIINIFGGWTVIGWITALAMAFRDAEKKT